MSEYIKNLFFSQTGKDTLVISIGTLANVIAGGLFFILAPRILGPLNFGVFSTVMATGLLLAAVANFGIDSGILNFAKNDSKANEVFSIAIKSYLVLGIGTAILGFILSKPLAAFLGQPQIAVLLNLAFIFTIFMLLTNFYVAALQSKKEFIKASVVNFSSNFARIVILAISAYFFAIGIYFVTLLFFSVTVISSLAGAILLKFDYVAKPQLKVSSFHKYNFWIALSLILASVPFDNYLLLKLSGPLQTGLYAAPFKILTFAYQFGGNFTRVLAPRFASFDSNAKAKNYSAKSFSYVAIAILALVFLILISNFVTRFFFGQSYVKAVPVMQILAIGFMFFFAATIPSSLILYYFGKSNISFLITLARYIAFVLLLVILIPRQNAIGAAYAFSLSEAFAFALMSLYVILQFQKKDVA